MSPDKVILYDYFASNCAWRVRTVLQWKNIPYETVTVDLVKGEQKTPEFLKINPYGAVPVLYIDGQYITQSIAICEYLEETRPENPIYPNNLTQRARVREIVEIINSYLVPLQNPTTAKKACSDPNEQRAWSLEFFYKGFVALERLVAKSSGRYTVGDTVTFADMCLVPQVWRAKRLKPDFTQFPTICRLYEELLELNAFRLAHAANHPHCPADIKADACLAIKSD
ncbi:maleylacetoacetate isomerase-like isoform X2 [Paramacrobiotus metropolitanus]|uniref:maleylacetoacetate isomerase-like isoform X2 n=1 Tax=Paramacrobiotus metropolitanus TaxID=2943436 RepID=UPI00244575E5|nr:maleylacetoacetate isomerase-like isoform X2 [Paramacrobiotus metropolitanus]